MRTWTTLLPIWTRQFALRSHYGPSHTDRGNFRVKPLVRMVELRGFEPPRFPAKTACEMRFVDPDVVTRAVPVLEICADVLRDVTVLAPV